MVRVIRDMLPEDMADRTDDKIMEKVYSEDDDLSYFL
jgi:hypothetical protein